MIAIKTIDRIPDGCNDNCICNHDGWCYAIHTNNGEGFDYQAAQDIRPHNCPLSSIDIVTCPDCIHCDTAPMTRNLAWCKLHNIACVKDHYCADGRRRPDES